MNQWAGGTKDKMGSCIIHCPCNTLQNQADNQPTTIPTNRPTLPTNPSIHLHATDLDVFNLGKQSCKLIHNLKFVQIRRIGERFSTNFDHIHQASHRLFLPKYISAPQIYQFPTDSSINMTMNTIATKVAKPHLLFFRSGFIFDFVPTRFELSHVCIHRHVGLLGSCYFPQGHTTTEATPQS